MHFALKTLQKRVFRRGNLFWGPLVSIFFACGAFEASKRPNIDQKPAAGEKNFEVSKKL